MLHRNPALRFLFVLAIGWSSSGASCADLETPRGNCVVDEECDGLGELCFQGACTTPCVTDEDCGTGGICRSELRSDQDDVIDVCVVDDDSNNAVDSECRFDQDCSVAFPGTNAQCGIDGTCYIPAFSLLIRDTTFVDRSSTPADGGLGADIAAVYLEDPATGEPVAWADALSVSPAADVDAINAPDGARERLTADGMCADASYDEAATPLGGEGGTLLVQFLEAQTGDTVATPPSSWNVVVVEWGDNCPGGELGEADSFEVFSCAATSHKSTDPDRDCGELLGKAETGGRLRIEAAEK